MVNYTALFAFLVFICGVTFFLQWSKVGNWSVKCQFRDNG